MNKEQNILQAHAAEVAQFSRRQDEDDISRAQRKYAEEGKLSQQHLDDQLARIRRSAEDQGISMGIGIAKGITQSLEPVKQAMTQMGKDASSALQQGFANGGLSKSGSSSGGRSLIGDIGNLFSGASGAIGNWYRHLGDNQRASGGPVTAGQPYLVGEHSPELFVPSQNGAILNQSQMKGVGGQSFVFNNYGNLKSDIDLRGALREFGFMVTR